MNNDVSSLLSALVESVLLAQADPRVTAVLRSWDWYAPGDKAQVLAPFLGVSVTDAVEIVPDSTLWTAVVSIDVIVNWAPAIREVLADIRGSVRSAMHGLPGRSAGDLTVDGMIEQSSSEPTAVNETGDKTFMQTIQYRCWFTAPAIFSDPVLPEPFLVDQADANTLYLTYSATDPRRIQKWTTRGLAEQSTAEVETLVSPGGSLAVCYGLGAWADRASLNYSPPLPPLSTSISRNLNINSSANAAADSNS